MITLLKDTVNSSDLEVPAGAVIWTNPYLANLDQRVFNASVYVFVNEEKALNSRIVTQGIEKGLTKPIPLINNETERKKLSVAQISISDDDYEYISDSKAKSALVYQKHVLKNIRAFFSDYFIVYEPEIESIIIEKNFSVNVGNTVMYIELDNSTETPEDYTVNIDGQEVAQGTCNANDTVQLYINHVAEGDSVVDIGFNQSAKTLISPSIPSDLN